MKGMMVTNPGTGASLSMTACAASSSASSSSSAAGGPPVAVLSGEPVESCEAESRSGTVAPSAASCSALVPLGVQVPEPDEDPDVRLSDAEE